MLNNSEFNWDTLDYIIAGAILLTAFYSIRFVLKKRKNHPYKNYLIILIIILFLLLWAEIAVGLLGSPIAGN